MEPDVYDNLLVTGRVDDALLEHFRRSVGQIVREGSGVRQFYIGRTSGDDAVSAARGRWRKGDHPLDVVRIDVVYESSSEDNAKAVEQALMEFFAEHDRNANRIVASTGAPSSQPKFFVYVAIDQ